MTQQEALNLALKHAQNAECSNTALVRGSWEADVKQGVVRDVMLESALATMWANIALAL